MGKSNDKKIVIDCGMVQEWDLKERNWEPFKVAPSEVDAVLLTHGHLDHLRCHWTITSAHRASCSHIRLHDEPVEIADLA